MDKITPGDKVILSCRIFNGASIIEAPGELIVVNYDESKPNEIILSDADPAKWTIKASLITEVSKIISTETGSVVFDCLRDS